MSKSRLYFPVESLVGLGHFNRAGKLARELISDGHEVHVASGTFVDRERFFQGASCYDLPSYVLNSRRKHYVISAQGERTLVENFNEQAWQRERISAHERNMIFAQADVLVSELWPFDRRNLDTEMMHVVNGVDRLLGKKSMKIAFARDILDLPQEEAGVERFDRYNLNQEVAANLITRHFDAVIVHGDQSFVPIEETYGCADEIRSKVIYAGYVVEDLPKRDPGNEFLVSCGSGADGEEMVLSFLTAWEKLLDRRDQGQADVAHMVNRPLRIVCGPKFHPEILKDVYAWKQYLSPRLHAPLEIDSYRQDFTQLLAKAAFSVSLAGYNTTLETLAIGTPTLMIPKFALVGGVIRYSTEQLFRLERLNQKGMARFSHPEEVLHASSFSARLLQEFTSQTGRGYKKRAELNISGAENTVSILNEALAARQNSRQYFMA